MPRRVARVRPQQVNWFALHPVEVQGEPVSQPAQTEDQPMPEGKAKPDNWTVIVGGINACKPDDQGDLIVRTTINAPATYRHITTAKLQALWEFFQRPEVVKIFDEFEERIAKELLKLGTAYGLQKGTIKEEEVGEVEALKRVWQ